MTPPGLAVATDASRFGQDVPTATSVKPRKLFGIPQKKLIRSEPTQTTYAVKLSHSIERKKLEK